MDNPKIACPNCGENIDFRLEKAFVMQNSPKPGDHHPVCIKCALDMLVK